MLPMSLNDILRLMLPTPDLETVASSATILCVLGLGFGRFGITAPALNERSERNESLSEANFRRALSKSTSFKGFVPFTWTPLIVTLLLLLSEPCFSCKDFMDWMDSRASSDRRDRRLYEFPLTCRIVDGEAEDASAPASSASATLSSSMVGSAGACCER